MQYRNMRLDMVEKTEQMIRPVAHRLGYNNSGIAKLFRLFKHDEELLSPPTLPPQLQEQAGLLIDLLCLRSVLLQSKTIIFSTEQAQIFQRMGESYTESVDYRLPYSQVYLQFTSPMTVRLDTDKIQLLGMALRQIYAPGGIVETANPSQLVLISGQEGETITYVNAICAIGQRPSGKLGVYGLTWVHSNGDAWLNQGVAGTDLLKSMAVGCIGYINCENIYLHQEGGAADAINRKREKQGKKILEPYYICRIRNVQYDSNGEPTGKGTHHSFRYDIRGHFRKLSTGKTTWVRSHQRGIKHELYIPKTYMVTKESA